MLQWSYAIDFQKAPPKLLLKKNWQCEIQIKRNTPFTSNLLRAYRAEPGLLIADNLIPHTEMISRYSTYCTLSLIMCHQRWTLFIKTATLHWCRVRRFMLKGYPLKNLWEPPSLRVPCLFNYRNLEQILRICVYDSIIKFKVIKWIYPFVGGGGVASVISWAVLVITTGTLSFFTSPKSVKKK